MLAFKGLIISGWQSSGNAGANLKYSFTAQPSSIYYVHVTSSGHKTSGAYRLIIKPLRAYDEYEQNDDILQAKPIPVGKPIDAGKMDGQDQDFYQFKTSSRAGNITVFIENRSTTLQPALRVFNSEKSDISGWQSSGNAGANLKYSFTAQPSSIYYVHVTSSGHKTSGAYRLTVKEE